MATYFDKILYLYPTIQGVMYWQTQYDGTPWENSYDGIVWENTEIEKPSKETLDALDDAVVDAELNARKEVTRKSQRNEQYSGDITVLSNFDSYKVSHPESTFSEYLDYLESLK